MDGMLFVEPKNAEFETFWQEFPRRVQRQYALKCFAKARRGAAFEVIMAGVKFYAASVAGKDERFMLHPSTWLNRAGWTDAEESANAVSAYTRYAGESDLQRRHREWRDGGRKGPEPRA